MPSRPTMVLPDASSVDLNDKCQSRVGLPMHDEAKAKTSVCLSTTVGA
jgi:hypothetical protein